MPRFVKQIFTGYKDVPGGASDPELEYVIQSKKEYQELWERIRKAEREALEAEETAKKKVEKAYSDARSQLSKYCKEADEESDRRIDWYRRQTESKDETIRGLRSDLEVTKEELKKQRNLNQNLKRIARERANAVRKITPKKEHDGYLILSSRQWVEHYEYTYKDEEYDAMDYEFKRRHPKPYKEHRKAQVWKSILQTPYDASLPLNQIKGIIEDDDLWNGGILRDIGCARMNINNNNGLYQTFGKNEEGYENNGLYKWKFIANYKSGFWELEIYTTKSLQVPEYRRPKHK